MSWKIDPAHSEITFAVRHMMITNVRGRFDQFDGSVEFDEENPANTTVEVQIEAASINTREEKRDAHLRSADFLDAEHYPYLSFKSSRIELSGDGRSQGQPQAKLYGELTIRDKTRPVVLEVSYNGQATSPYGTTVAGFSARGKLNRKDWDLVWNVPLETGGVLVGESLDLNIELEIVKQAEAEAALA